MDTSVDIREEGTAVTKCNRAMMRASLRRTLTLVVPVGMATAGALLAIWPVAHADNKRLNAGVFANIYTAQRQNGCRTEPQLDGRLVDAARRHALDVVAHPDVNGDVGSDGSTVQDRGRDAGFSGRVVETIAINLALAISGVEILNQWWSDPAARATMQDCSNTAIGVWSENSIARTVVVAVYGQPGTP